MSNEFSGNDQADLDLVRRIRLKFIEGLLNGNDLPAQDNNGDLLRALKDTEMSVLNKAKLDIAKDDNQSKEEQNRLLHNVLLHIGQTSDKDDSEIELIKVPLRAKLTQANESDEVVTGETGDSASSVRDILPTDLDLGYQEKL